MSEIPEWVQIKDPKSKKLVYVNVTNGDYRSNLPPNTLFKFLEENQWWQLYDNISSCYYYYNTSSHQTVWKRPAGVEVIPLYKVQQFNQEKAKDWKVFLNRKLEGPKRANFHQVSASPSLKWNLLSNSRKYSFNSNNNLENIKLRTKYSPNSVDPVLESKSFLKSLKSSVSDDEGLDSFASHNFCSVANIGYSTLHSFRMKSLHHQDLPCSPPPIKPKTSGCMSRSYDQMNIDGNDEWIVNENDISNTVGSIQHVPASNRTELCTPQKPHQGFPRTNPHLTMQRSSSSFRSNKDSFLLKDQFSTKPSMIAAQSVANCSQETFSTVTRSKEINKKRQFIENDHRHYKSIFPNSFNFNFQNNFDGDKSVQLLSFKPGAVQNDATLTRTTNEIQQLTQTTLTASSQSSLMTSSVMSSSMKSCDMNDELTSVDQTSIRSAATRGTDECDSVFSSSSSPPPMRSSSVPTWAANAAGPIGRRTSLIRKPGKDKSTDSTSSINKSQKADYRPHGFCHSESDTQWDDDDSRNIFSYKYSHFSSFAQFTIKELGLESFNDHRKRFLGKLLPIGCLLNWTKDGIRKPILRTHNRVVNREAPDIFKRIQLYMGDRSLKRSHSSTSSSSISRISSHKPREIGGVPSKVDQSVLTVIVRGWMLADMRDEIYIQLCKQTNGNPNWENLCRGWELICICLSFFPPARLTSCLKQRLNEANSIFANCNHQKLLGCLKQVPRRLENVLASGAKKGVCKPTTQEFEVSRDSIYTPPLFGSLLTEVMEIQKEKFPQRHLPWIITTLSEAVLRLNGMSMEGIFRIPGDIDEVNRLKAEVCEKWAFPSEPLRFDASVPASLFKLWLRQLHEPLIPYDVYNDCLNASNNPLLAIEIVTSGLPHINRSVLAYVVRFLQVFAAPPVCSKTKMDASNLAMVMAPNLLRSHVIDPSLLLDQAKKEMSFVRVLIMNWDTSFMENLV